MPGHVPGGGGGHAGHCLGSGGGEGGDPLFAVVERYCGVLLQQSYQEDTTITSAEPFWKGLDCVRNEDGEGRTED